jgi:acetyl esterase/lipase
MCKFLCAGFIVLVCVGVDAQTDVWQPSKGHSQMAIWPDKPPDAQLATGPEAMQSDPKNSVAGRPWFYIENVTQPTITVYSPKKNNSGVAMVVFPGGGYRILAIDLEGTEVADWLTSRGITCILLKYRVPGSGPYWDEENNRRVYPKAPMALEDAQRALRLARFHATEWHIDPHKIGVLGFSAGGHVVAGMSTRFDEQLYPPVDEADKQSCRPDFSVALYPGHLWANEDNKDPSTLTDEHFELRPDIKPGSQTPPTLLVQATNDDVDPVNESVAYYLALKKAGVPVELHLFAEGGHGFGLRRTKLPITAWPELMMTWLRTIGVISK